MRTCVTVCLAVGALVLALAAQTASAVENCARPAPAVRRAVVFPRTFPRLHGLVITHAVGSDDRLTLNGYWRGTLGLAARTYRAELQRNGYSAGGEYAPTAVVIPFYGHFTVGRIDLRTTCGGRVAVHIAIQPGQ